jgi:hypothetical protein
VTIAIVTADAGALAAGGLTENLLQSSTKAKTLVEPTIPWTSHCLNVGGLDGRAFTSLQVVTDAGAESKLAARLFAASSGLRTLVKHL